MKKIGNLLSIVAVIGVICAGLILCGARLGLWEPLTGFGLYRSYFSIVGAVVAGTGLLGLALHISRKETGRSVLSAAMVVIGMACLFPGVSAALNPQPRAAPIHDISTDTVNPPLFEVLDETRAGATNSLEYGGPELAAAQAEAYPDIGPLDTAMPADAAYARALAVADEMGWEIVASDAEQLRFEATARTSVFYFADDVVIVLSTQPDGSRVDMRSVSRVGRSDQGLNAARIRDFQQKFVEE